MQNDKSIIKKFLLLFILTGGLSCFSLAQKHKIDSLENLLKTAKRDTSYVKILNELSRLRRNHGDYALAVQNAYSALKEAEKLNYKTGKAVAYNYIGIICNIEGKTSEAIANYLESLKIARETNDKTREAAIYNNLGNVYSDQKNFDEALENYNAALKLNQELKYDSWISNNLDNICNVHSNLGNYSEALKYGVAAFKIREKNGNEHDLAYSYNNLGTIYYEIKKFDSALVYLNNSLEIFKKYNNKDGIKASYSSLADLYSATNNYEKAYNNYVLYIAYKDSLFNEVSSKQIVEVQAKYDSEKKENELIKKDAEIIIQRTEAEKNQSQRNAFIIGFFMVLILAFFAFRGYKQKITANMQLEEKNKTITIQGEEIENKNTQIISSIQYAKGIQDAILPIKTDLQRLFPNHFILNKPKDIVGGDFYWMHENEKKLYFAVADCTGHGVPGAFVTFMGHNMLENIVDSKENLCPSEILEKLNNRILKILKQENSNTTAKHGMDIGLISIDKKSNEIEYAGARHSLLIFRGNDFFELKGNRRSIGSVRASSHPDFNNQHFQLFKGDIFYLFSDGFRDQKGDPENKKMYFEPFKDLLQSISSGELDEQYRILERTFQDWKGNNKQTDDVLVVGIRV